MQLLFDNTTGLLKTVSVTSGGFVEATKTLTKASADFDDDFAVGDMVTISGTTHNNGTFTVTAVAANTITFSEALVDETSNAELNTHYYGDWSNVVRFEKLIGTINASQDCTLYVVQSQFGVVEDIVSTTAVTGGAASSFEIAIFAPFARMRILNGGTDQTALRAFLNGRMS